MEGGIIMAVSCCTALSFSTLEIASVSVCGPFSQMKVGRLWVFFNPLMKILMVAAWFIKMHLLASVLNWWMYTASDSFSCCWISMKCELQVWISALQSFSCNKSFISSHHLSELMASVTNVHVTPLDFTLASLVLLSFVRSVMSVCLLAILPIWWSHVH